MQTLPLIPPPMPHPFDQVHPQALSSSQGVKGVGRSWLERYGTNPTPLTDTTIIREVHSKLLQLDPQIPPPGAPGAIDDAGGLRRDGTLTDRRNRVAPDVTPRAGPMDLPMTNTPTPGSRMRRSQGDISTNQTPTTMRGGQTRTGDGNGMNATAAPIGRNLSQKHHHHHCDTDKET